MSANEQLQNAYQEWRRLAETEGEAIQSRNWTLVATCQDSLQHLQPQIIRWTQEAREEWVHLGLDVSSRENSFRVVIGELIEIERRNSSWLSEVRHTAQAELSALNQADHTLRQIHRSYGPSRAPAWTSFS